jgi:hypothetical protein
LSARQLESKSVSLNGVELKLGAGDSLPQFKGVAVLPGTITLELAKNLPECVCQLPDFSLRAKAAQRA